MRARDASEGHRAATPLELFFDLVFVVAIAQAASGLHHAISEAHIVDGLLGFTMVFFAIWWAWMNFTWFASAYDTDDVPYRLAVFVQITGALILAAGVPDAFAEFDFTLATVGYVVMRTAAIVQWIRASREDPERRPTALRYAVGIFVVQLGWIGLLWVGESAKMLGFLILVVLEIGVPIWAELAVRTTWHAHHIAERYGLFTIIVLGESVLAATVAIEAGLDGGETVVSLLPTIGGGMLTLYAMWWLYFDRPVHGLLTTLPRAFIWGYWHYLVFGACAAVGAGLAVYTDYITHTAHVSRPVAGAAVAAPAALYLLVLWILHRRVNVDDSTPAWPAPVAMVALLGAPFTPNAPLAVGLTLTMLLGIKLYARHHATPHL